MRPSFLPFILIASFLLSAEFASAQFNYLATNAQVFQGVYTDLGNLGTRIDSTYNNAGPMDYDDTISTVQNIGFTFRYNGTNYTQFVLSTNGYIALGTNPVSDVNYDFLNSLESNIIAPFNIDLEGGTNPEYRVRTSGVAGARVCTIQFKNTRDLSYITNQYSNINFQIKLYETSNNIEFVYGTFTSTGAPSAVIQAKTGIKGSSVVNSVNAVKSSLIDYLATSFIDGNYVNNKFNNRNSVMPVSGFTIRFVAVPLSSADAKVAAVFSMGEVPLGFGFPHTVSARIRNVGSQTMTDIPVYLNVSGANSFRDTQQIASLPPGANVDITFNGYSCSATGFNDVRVSIGRDSNITNNSLSYDQRVNKGLFSYANSAPIAGKSGFETGSGVSLVKYYVNGRAYLTGARVHISNDTVNIGKTVFAEVTNRGGAVLTQSPFIKLTASDLNSYKEFCFIQPILVVFDSVYIGFGQLASTSMVYPMSYQNEIVPARERTYFSTFIGGGGLGDAGPGGIRYMIQAIFNSYPVTISGQPAEVCAGGSQTLASPVLGSTYQWMINKGNGFVNISDSVTYTGTQDDTLKLAGIPSSWYGYQFACKVDGLLGPAYYLRITSYWTGAVTNVWANPGNWSCGVIPDGNTDVIIPSGICVLSSVQSCRSIYINEAATFTSTTAGKLTVTN